MSRLTLVCGSEPCAGNQVKAAYGSADNGTTWDQLAAPPISGYVSIGAAGTFGTFMTGGRMALDATLRRRAHVGRGDHRIEQRRRVLRRRVLRSAIRMGC